MKPSENKRGLLKWHIAYTQKHNDQYLLFKSFLALFLGQVYSNENWVLLKQHIMQNLDELTRN